jgi:hypothetical protein
MAKSGIKHIDVGAALSEEEWESEESHELVHGNSFPDSPVERQVFYRDDEHKWYVYNGSSWIEVTAGGISTFLALTDTPAAYTGQAGKYTKVNAGETALEFDTPSGSGDMTKAVYDTDDDGIVDNSEKLEGSTKAQVQNHSPITHKTSHENAGGDEISLAGLDGEPATLTTHKDLTTGVHGVGAGTIAKVGDIAVDANLSAAGQDAISKKHTQLCGVADFTKLDGIEASAVALATVKADSDIADAISKKHSQNTDTDLDATFEATFEKVANKGAANGYCGLGAGGLVDVSDLPSVVVVEGDVDDTPANEATTDPISSNWAYDHVADKSAHHSNVLSLTFIIDGGGSAITTGEKGHLEIPFACTITQVTMLADQSGSIVVDVWKDSYANFPPTDADSITASAPPTISSAQKSQDATLTDWTTAISAGDILAFNVDSCTTITRVTISIRVTKT